MDDKPELEPGFYWVLYGDEWQPAEFVDGRWWVIGSDVPVRREHMAEIGPAIIKGDGR